MSCTEQYESLEAKFKKQINEDNDRWGVGSCFLSMAGQ